jgi:MFS family permease
MSTISRKRLTLSGSLWGLLLALLPAAFAFDGFSLSPFLLAALFLSALSGAVGALVAGRRAFRRLERAERSWSAASGIGALQGIVAAVLSTLLIWLALTATMTGFSPAAPAKILVLFRDPTIFLQSALAAVVVFAYAAFVGLLLAPLVGSLIMRLVREDDSRASRRIVGTS